MEKISAEEFKRQKPKRPKYRNTPTTRDGVKFHSKLEADRWDRLSILQKAGAITDLQRQVPFELQPGFVDNEGIKIRPIVLVVDFAYTEKGQKYVEDTKGMIALHSALKIKMFKFIYHDYIFRIVRKA